MRIEDLIKAGYKIKIIDRENGIMKLALLKDDKIFATTDHGTGIFLEPIIVSEL